MEVIWEIKNIRSNVYFFQVIFIFFYYFKLNRKSYTDCIFLLYILTYISLHKTAHTRILSGFSKFGKKRVSWNAVDQ